MVRLTRNYSAVFDIFMLDLHSSNERRQFKRPAVWVVNTSLWLTELSNDELIAGMMDRYFDYFPAPTQDYNNLGTVTSN